MSQQQATVLIVEDDEVDVELVTRGLRKRDLSVDVHTAIDGSTALQVMRDSLSAEQRSRLIVLLDLNMPRMNGHEFLSELRSDATLRKTVVFVLTTSCLESDISRAYDKNVAGYFAKANVDALLDILGGYAEQVEYPELKQHADD